MLANIETVVYGKHDEISLVLASLACEGHVLLEDVPGTAKTVLARAIAQTIEGATVARIQCTPDLQPTDVTGLSIYNQKTRDFEFRPGPVFANVLLVDEINRAMPKTQSALLEAMAERQVTVDGVTRPLPHPFFVIATENPIEQEGTFPLPEAQLDRFGVRATLGYPAAEEEVAIVREQRHGHPLGELEPGGERRRRARRCRRRSRRSTSTTCCCGGSSTSSARRARWRGSRPAPPSAAASRSSGRRGRGRSCAGASTWCPRTSRRSSCPCSATGSW